MFAIGVVILTVLANLLVAIAVLKKNPLSITNRLVATLSIITALWTVFNFLALSPGSEEVRLFWVRTVMFVTSSYGTVILLLADAYPGPKLSLTLKSLTGIASVNVLCYLLAYSPYMFVSVVNNPDGSFASLNPGWAILIYAVGFMGFMTLGFIKLIKKLKVSSGLLHTQLKLFLTGLVVSFTLLTLTNFVAVLVFKSVQLTYLGPPFTLILFGYITYAIVRHRFLDITSIVARAVTFTIVLTVVILIEAALVYIGTRILPVDTDEVLVAVLGSIFIVMGYSTLNATITRLTDRIFFQGRYDTEDLLKSLTTIMVQEMHIDKLARALLTILNTQMRVEGSAFVITKDKGVKSVVHVGFPKPVPFSASSLDKLLRLENKLLVFEDLVNEEDKDFFRQNNLAVIIPLQVQDELIGFLLLGPKSSGDIYNARDIEFLEIFAPQGAIAIKNAESYREIQEFNMTLEGKVAERTKELEASQAAQLRLKDEFVFIATHDLATPVTAISGFTAMINERKEKISKELRSDLDTISEASNRLKVLVNDLLQVARSDAGTIKVELTQVDAGEIIASTVRQLEPVAKEKKVTVNVAPIKDGHVMADPKKLAEVIENLVSNAIKYNREGGTLDISATAKDLPAKAGKRLVLEFKDTGLGIPDSEQGKVFTKFFRSEAAEVRARPGTGLGLFVVRMLTEKMGGTITFSSKQGQGTTFWLEFDA